MCGLDVGWSGAISSTAEKQSGSFLELSSYQKPVQGSEGHLITEQPAMNYMIRINTTVSKEGQIPQSLSNLLHLEIWKSTPELVMLRVILTITCVFSSSKDDSA